MSDAGLAWPLWGVDVRQVEPGTVIRDPATGQEATVADDSIVMLGRLMHITPNTFDALKAHPAFTALGKPA